MQSVFTPDFHCNSTPPHTLKEPSRFLLCSNHAPGSSSQLCAPRLLEAPSCP